MLWLFRISGLFLPFFVLGDLNYFSLRAALKVHTANMSLVLPTIIRVFEKTVDRHRTMHTITKFVIYVGDVNHL